MMKENKDVLCPCCHKITDRMDFTDHRCNKCWGRHDMIETAIRIILVMGCIFLPFIVIVWGLCEHDVFIKNGYSLGWIILAGVSIFSLIIAVIKGLIDVVGCNKPRWWPLFLWA